MAARSVLRALGDPEVDLACYVADVAAITGETAVAVVRSAGRLRPAVREARALAREGKDHTAEALALVGLGALAAPAQARERYATAEKLAGDAPEVAGPLRLNLARLDEREDRTAEARAGYRAAIAPLAQADERVGLLAALRAAARLSGSEPGGAAEAADLHRRAAAVADGLGLAEVAERERASAERRPAR